MTWPAASAARSSVTSRSRCRLSCSIDGSYMDTRRPTFLALDSATSTRRIMVAPSSPWSGASATPTVADASIVSPASGYDVETASRSSAASSAASLAPGTRTATANSSAPTRATIAPSGELRLSRWPTRTSSSSPQVCPSESLTSLNRSRSSWTRATTPSPPAASSIAVSRCWPSRARVGSPVSRSWYAACRSRATRSWFSIAAVSRVARLSATCTSSAV